MWQAPYCALEYYLCYLILTPKPHTYYIFTSLEIKKQRHRADKRTAEATQLMSTRQRLEPRQLGPSAVLRTAPLHPPCLG